MKGRLQMDKVLRGIKEWKLIFNGDGYKYLNMSQIIQFSEENSLIRWFIKKETNPS